MAPTHKISDDAQYPQFSSNPAPSPQLHAPMATPAPVVAYGGAASGRAATDPSEPPASLARRPTPVPVAAPRGSSVAMPAQGRRWGLVVAILVVDLGLAAAGALLLVQGLRDDAPRAAPAPSPAPPPASAPGSAAPPAKAAATEPAKAKPVMVVSKAVVKAVKPPVAPPAKVAGKAAKPGKKGGAAPVDPYATPAPPAPPDDDDHSAAISDAIDAKSTRAEGVFSRCYTQATKPLPADQPLRGRIQIAFTVLSNGHVDHVTTAENQTGSAQLANCLASEIGGWIFDEHPQDPMEITKIFAFGPSSS